MKAAGGILDMPQPPVVGILTKLKEFAKHVQAAFGETRQLITSTGLSMLLLSLCLVSCARSSLALLQQYTSKNGPLQASVLFITLFIIHVYPLEI